MKLRTAILTCLGTFFAIQMGSAQEEQNQVQDRSPRIRRESLNKKEQKEKRQTLSIRAQNLNKDLTQNLEKAAWMRIIYREIDLTKEKNGPLYYPVRPTPQEANLFARIFRLILDGTIKAYNYNASGENFDEKEALQVKDFLDRYHILYRTEKKGDQDTFIIENADLPSEEVMAYYIKEAWYFDENNSVFDVKPIALCPIMFTDDEEGERRWTLFWVSYEEIRPYIAMDPVMLSEQNNVKTASLDDYFRNRMFDGAIVMTKNFRNTPLQVIAKTPDSLAVLQKKVEKELTSFQDSLYVMNDSTFLKQYEKKKSKKGLFRRSAKKTKNHTSVSTQARKESSKAPVRSVRNRRH